MAGKIKLANKTTPEKEQKKSFEEMVGQNESQNKDYNSRSRNLGIQFHKLLADRTLASQKPEVSKRIEQELLSQIQSLGSEINAHPNQPEGAGSTFVEAIMLSTVLKMRDRINDLEFRLAQLEKSQPAKSENE